MTQAAQLSSLIGAIYDAALDSTAWPVALGLANAFVGGSSAAIYAKDVQGRTADLYFDDGGIDPHFVKLYFDRYVAFDPSTALRFFAEVGEPMATADLMPYEEFLETRFYKEWVRPQGLADHLTSVLDKSATRMALFGVFRNERQGVADEPMRERMRLVAPHVRRATLIGRLIDLKSEESATFADTLDGLRAGMFLVDATGRIVHANMTGHAMLAMEGPFRSAGGRLDAVDAAADRTLQEIFAAAGDGIAAVGRRGIAVALPSPDGTRFVAHVLPLSSAARTRASAPRAAVAALFVHQAATDAPSPPEVIARTYRLTPTELRVLLAIVEVGGVPQVARALGIGETTVKTHLGRLYEKTATHRQADLVKLIARFSTPLVD